MICDFSDAPRYLRELQIPVPQNAVSLSSAAAAEGMPTGAGCSAASPQPTAPHSSEASARAEEARSTLDQRLSGAAAKVPTIELVVEF